MRSKLVFRLVLILLVVPFVRGQQVSYIDRVVDYLDCTYCYFISLNVQSDAYTGKAIIENDNLYTFLHESAGMSKARYGSFVKSLLQSGKSLKIKNATLNPTTKSLDVKRIQGIHFSVVQEPDQEVKDLFKKGCVATISSLFTVNLLNQNLQDCEALLSAQNERTFLVRRPINPQSEPALVAQLFDWNVLVRLDDLAGRLVIVKR
jgi:hypothetical protein